VEVRLLLLVTLWLLVEVVVDVTEQEEAVLVVYFRVQHH
jgi:hypothetical protein